MVKAIEYYREGMNTVDDTKRIELMKNILDIAADNLWAIGTVKSLPMYKIANPNLRNIPTEEKAYSRGGDAARIDLWYMSE